MNDVVMDLNHQDLSMTDLSWIICYEGRIYNMLAAEERKFNPPPRLDLDKIPSTFFSARKGDVRLLSETLQLNKILQTQLDEVYTKFCNLILAEMEATISIKRARRSQDIKPWWNPFLKRARKHVQILERKWLNCKLSNSVKQQYKEKYKAARNRLVTAIRKAK